MLDPFYLIVDSAAWIARLLPCGVRIVQLRIKDQPDATIRAEIEESKALCERHGAKLVVNDYWQHAIDAACDFIHLGQGDLDAADLPAIRRAGIKFGVSTHDEAELARAIDASPDYIALGPIYPTILKAMAVAPHGLPRITEWKKKIGKIPLVGIGGITLARVAGVLQAGADSAAVVTDISRNADPEQRARDWVKATRRFAGSGMLPKPRYLPAGESALVVEFGDTIHPKIHDLVLALDAAVQQANWEGVIETVPTYRSLMIHFDPRRLTTEALADALARLDYASAPPQTRRQLWRIPACYDPPHGEDIAEAAALLGLSPARIIGLHLGARYRVYMYGFAPGFTFLGGLPNELAIPRRAVPRAPVPPGSLLIAGGQALIAGCAMPTGWFAIGRTPVKMFDPRRGRIFLAGIGDELWFERIDPAAFDAMTTAAEAGEFCARREYLDEA